MRVGLYIVPLTAQIEALRAVAERADRDESLHSLWIPEPHLLAFSHYDSAFPYAEDGKMPDDYSAEGELDGLLSLAFLAALTSRIRIGIGVCIVPQRQPIYLAKEVTTLDHLSNGRFDFGIGIGWLEEEFGAVGASFADRAARTTGHIELMKALWSRDPAESGAAAGPLAGARQEPYPVQQPHPPIHVGGNSRRALERVADLGRGWLPWDLSPDDAQRGIAEMEALLEARGRSRNEIEVSVAATKPVEEIDAAAYSAAGVDQLLVVVPTPRSQDDVALLFDRIERAGLAGEAAGSASER